MLSNKELAFWFGGRPEADDVTERWAATLEAWRKRAQTEGASVWRRKANPITQRLAENLQQDTGIGLNTPAGFELKRVSAHLLAAFHGDYDLLFEALERCRKRTKWQGVEPYAARYHVQNEASRLVEGRKRQQAILDKLARPLPQEEELIACPRCGRSILPYRIDLPCAGH